MWTRGKIAFVFLLQAILLMIIPCKALSIVHSFERAIPEKKSETTIYAIAQDHDGFIWFATREGLWKFDGHTTKEYRYNPGDPNSISSSFIRALLVDKQGRLWAGTTGGGLNQYVAEYDHFIRYMSVNDDKSTLSHNDVLYITQDNDNVIWVCTEDGFNKLDQQTGTFTRYYMEENPREGYQNRAFLSMLEDRSGNFWVASYFRGLFLFDKETGTYQPVDLNKIIGNQTNIADFYLWCLFEDSKGRIWIGTRNQGLFMYDKQNEIIQQFHTQSARNQRISNNIVYHVTEDLNGKIWIGTENGLNIYDPVQQEMAVYYSSYDDPATISNNAVWTIMEDLSGTVWLGGWEGYADKWDPKSKRFYPRMSQGIVPTMPLQYNAILEDRKGRLLVGTNSGLMIFPDFVEQKQNNRFIIPNNHQKFFIGSYVPAIIEDPLGVIWMATNNGIQRFTINESGTKLNMLPLRDASLLGNFITTVFIDSRNTIWLGTQNGLCQYIRDTDSFKRYLANTGIVGSLSHKQVTAIYEDRNGIIWVGTTNGLNRLNQTTGSFTNFYHQHNNSKSLAIGVIHAIFHDSRGLLWVGTSAGLSCASDYSGIFRNFYVEDGLSGNYISAIYEDESGYIWVSTNQGISRLEIAVNNQHSFPQVLDEMKVKFWNLNVSDGLIDMSFKRGSIAKLSNGEVLFGGTHGISSLFTKNIEYNTFVPPVVFTDLKVNNKSVDPSSNPEILESQIGTVKTITLNHKHSVVTFDFVALSFTNSDKNQFAYIMEGFDKEWIYAGSRRSATYTNLNPGKYTFKVKASNNDGLWNETGNSIAVVVHPPPWKTLPAFLIYLLVLTSAIFGYVHLSLSKIKAESKLKVQKLESDKISEMNYFRSVFYTNISHEFRTPLTLIIGPLTDILSNTQLSDDLKKQIKLIQFNAVRMLRLINQLLDISKVEAGHIKLKVNQGNIVELVCNIFDAFKIKAEKENIKYRFYTSNDVIDCYFDADKVEKILYNLLSNAFKHTPKDGKIDVLLFLKQDVNANKLIEIIVHDSGPGIPPDKQKQIFERYFVISESKVPWQSSTGIGLSLANQLALVHKGEIALESIEDSGSKFIVKLPVYPEAFSIDEIQQESPVDSSEKEHIRMMIEYESQTFLPETTMKKDQAVVLLVEDNQEVRKYIQEKISVYYQVLMAPDGASGFEVATEQIPDVIVSDVMMPVMDGFELCRKIKADERTSHIPVILLTAKTSDENRIEGYETGADAYISKPFQMAGLLARIRNLIDSRNKLREIFGKRMSLEPSEISMNSIDESFIQKAIEIIEKNMSEPELNVEVLCSKIGMSRSQAFRKFKAITNLSPVEFIRMIRIKRAAQLLKQKCGTISEIAYMVGFSDLDYFRKCFKEQFGVTPTKFIESNSQDS